MANAKVVIQGYNNLKAPLKESQQDLISFGKVAEKVGNTLKTALGVTTAIVAVKKLGDALSGCFKNFSEAERKYKQLNLALGDTKAYDSITKKIRELSKITLAGKDNVESMVSELAGLGYAADEINRISEAAVHLSNITGDDLNTSMKTLMNTYNGNVKALTRLGIDTSDLTKKQLENGAAVDLVIKKYSELSRQMAADDNSQHLVNIRDNFDDIKQSIGELVSFSIAPLLAKVDAWSEKAVGAVDNFVQRVKVVLENLPEVWNEFITTIKKSLSQLFSIEGIQALVNGIFNIVISKIKLIGNAAANIFTLVQKVGEEALKGLGNYAMYWITHITDSLGINISEVINSIGDWLTTSPIGKFVDNIVTKAVNGVRLVAATIRNLPDIFRIVLSHIGDMILQFIKAIPSALKNLGSAILNRGIYIVLHLKNAFLQGLEDLITRFGEIIQSTWVGKALKFLGLDLGGKLASVDFGIDRTSENEAYSKAESAMSNVGNAFSGVREVAKEMGDEINALMSPTFEKFVADNSTTIGQAMAKWTAKSSDDYYEAAKKNFSNIGDFLQDWGSTFLGDLKDDWGDVKSAFEDTFKGAFGGNWDNFLRYLKKLTDSGLVQGNTQTSSAGSGGDNTKYSNFLDDFAGSLGNKISSLFNVTDTAGAEAGKSLVGSFVNNLGDAGTVISNIAKNMATMGPVVGAIVTSFQYVMEGFGEIVSGPLNEFTHYVIYPLRELGRVIGDMMLPVINTLIPIVKRVADVSVQLFNALGASLMPVIQIISEVLSPVLEVIGNILEALMPVIKVFTKIVVTITSTFQWLLQTFTHWIASFLNGLASISVFGIRPFGWMAVEDPGDPGSLGSFIQNKWDAVDAAFNRTAAPYEGGADASTTQAVSNASYSGATTVHLNVYNYGNVVGEDGITEFAGIIRDRLLDLDYMGR